MSLAELKNVLAGLEDEITRLGRSAEYTALTGTLDENRAKFESERLIHDEFLDVWKKKKNDAEAAQKPDHEPNKSAMKRGRRAENDDSAGSSSPKRKKLPVDQATGRDATSKAAVFTKKKKAPARQKNRE